MIAYRNTPSTWRQSIFLTNSTSKTRYVETVASTVFSQETFFVDNEILRRNVFHVVSSITNQSQSNVQLNFTSRGIFFFFCKIVYWLRKILKSIDVFSILESTSFLEYSGSRRHRESRPIGCRDCICTKRQEKAGKRRVKSPEFHFSLGRVGKWREYSTLPNSSRWYSTRGKSIIHPPSPCFYSFPSLHLPTFIKDTAAAFIVIFTILRLVDCRRRNQTIGLRHNEPSVPYTVNDKLIYRRHVLAAPLQRSAQINQRRVHPLARTMSVP